MISKSVEVSENQVWLITLFWRRCAYVFTVFVASAARDTLRGYLSLLYIGELNVTVFLLALPEVLQAIG